MDIRAQASDYLSAMEASKRFCEQCERRVSDAEAIRCQKRYCTLNPEPYVPTKGIFSTTAAQGLALRNANRRKRAAAQKAEPMATLDVFAEYLSHHDLGSRDKGGDVPRVAARMGIDAQYANALLQRIRRRLGSQAR